MSSINDIIIPVVGILMVFGSPVAIIGLILAAIKRKSELQHESLNRSIESGQPLPDEVLRAFVPKPRNYNHAHIGILLIALALGAGLCATMLAGIKMASIAAIPLFLGIAFFLLHKLSGQPLAGDIKD